MPPSGRRLSCADVRAIANEMKHETEQEKRESWVRDKRKRKRVLLVGAMIAIAFVLEEHFKLSWGHRIFEIGTDCIADFLLFGSME